jgi:hypothetical protein
MYPGVLWYSRSNFEFWEVLTQIGLSLYIGNNRHFLDLTFVFVNELPL